MVDEKIESALALLKEALAELEIVESELGVIDPWDENELSPDQREDYFRLLAKMDALELAIGALEG